jgi:serine protease Do
MKEYKDDSFCSRPLGPWIVGVIVISVMLLFWVLMKKEEIFHGVEMEQFRGREQERASVVPKKLGEPVFPGPVQQAAMVTPQLAAITKATPNGGIQLVAHPSDSVFQDSLKDAVNAIIPAVCDIHARRVVRSPDTRRAADAQNLKFLPPFDGVIDKFIQNKGYENIGAGIIVDERGYVLTNSHVTWEATDVVVTVFGSPVRDYHADIVAQSPKQDLALLKIRGQGLFPEAKLGDSSFCSIGDYVIAVGSPFGIEQTVTSGIISGVRKSIVIEGVRYPNLFQIDAPINRGSSGGPLVNLKGEVIGINTAIYAPTGVFSGTGFAILINDCKGFLAENLGRNFSMPVDRRGMLAVPVPAANPAPGALAPVRFGLEVITVNAVIAAQFGIPQGQGVLVNRVIEDSPASFAGIQRGDIITAIAGAPITAKEDIGKVIGYFKAGDHVNIRLLRNGRTDEVLVKLQ